VDSGTGSDPSTHTVRGACEEVKIRANDSVPFVGLS
jgi:hypothetical protein